MTSPAIATVGATAPAGAVTSTTITVPASIAAGNLLVAFLFIDTAAGDGTWPGDWTALPSITQASSGLTCQMAYKYASGSETNFSVTHGSGVTRARCYRITGHAGPTRPPLASTWQGASSAGPGPVTPNEWKQAQDILSILATTWENTTPSGGVTGYTNEFNAGSGTLGARCEQRSITGFSGTEDPVNYTTGSGNRCGYTVLIPSDNDDPDLTFPIVRNQIGQNSGSATTVLVKLPVQREAGDILTVAIGLLANVAISSGLPSGWDTEVSVLGGGAGGERHYVLWKRADGTETDFTLTMTGSSAYNLLTHAIMNVDSDADVFSASAASGAATTTPDPPNLSAVADLWMATAQTENAVLVSYPTNYTHKQNTFSSTASIHVAFRQLSATSEDPGVFTVGSSRFATAATLAIGKANPRFFQASWS